MIKRNIYIGLESLYFMKKTTIQLNVKTLKRLKAFKNFERQSYDEILNRLIDEWDEESLSEEESLNEEEMQKGLEDIKRGKVKSIEQVARELGIVLK